MRLAAIIFLAAVAASQAPPAQAEDGRVEAIVNPMGGSLSQEPRVLNFASPMVELRATHHYDSSTKWIAADFGLALLVLPEHVLEARVAARFYPWRLAGSNRFAEALYLRPGVHSLLVIDGLDLGPDLEIGIAPSHRGVSLLGGVSLASYLVNPRIVGELRFGVGFLF